MTKREAGIGGKDPSKQQPKCTNRRAKGGRVFLLLGAEKVLLFSLRLQGCEGAAMFIKERKCSVKADKRNKIERDFSSR